MNVIAVNDDSTILVWGGLNSVFWLRRGEPIAKGWEANLAFQDLRDLTGQFKIKNKKVEIDGMIADLKKTFTKK